jgi:sucrose phosphorylase
MKNNSISNGVMFNAYPDSIGSKLSDTVKLFQRPEFKDVFSLFYVLPTFFNSDLDRGFSIIDYNLNKDLVSKSDLEALKDLNIELKFDIVLNHLSVASPQFKDLIKNGEQSKYKDFFINWNNFWEGNATMGNDGIMIPHKTFLDKLFMRKSGLPVLQVPFPDGSVKPYWNTFYQKVTSNKINLSNLESILEQSNDDVSSLCARINKSIDQEEDLTTIDFGKYANQKPQVLHHIYMNSTFLGQMDVNAKSDLIWEFYQETLEKVSSFGGKILRLDAFAYLHKQVGETNFFNTPGTWSYLSKIKKIADEHDLMLLPEIHAEYGVKLHEEVAEEGYFIYDFFLPGLTIHTLESKNNSALLKWIHEIVDKKYKTVNMLGCHDGIPVLDLKGKEVNGAYNKGLLEDKEIENIMTTILNRGGRVKNLYDAEGNKISYYQVNATYFSALNEDETKLLMARAIQMFMPGIPQIWYLDLFAGKNDYEAADKAGSGGHKEINRTNLSLEQIDEDLQKEIVLKQLALIRFRNTCKAFSGNIKVNSKGLNKIDISWSFEGGEAILFIDLISSELKVHQKSKEGVLTSII